MQNYCKAIPCGTSIPFVNPHAVSVSLPTLQDVIGYEEGDITVLSAMQSGYPRFFTNKVVEKLIQYVREIFGIAEDLEVLPIASQNALTILRVLVQEQLVYETLENAVFLVVPKTQDKLAEIKNYIRNAGLIVSSRQAESILWKLGVIPQKFQENIVAEELASAQIISVLSQAYQTTPKNVLLTNSGANAIFSVCESLISSQKKKDKNTVVQLGWLYLDTMEVIQKRGDKIYVQWNVHALQELEKWLEVHAQEVAVLVTEVVTNPKLQCVAIPELYAICQKFGILLVLDATLITPFHAPVLQFCDVAVESLSKFACGNADLLMGAIIVSEHSGINPDAFLQYAVPPFIGELQRLAFEIKAYAKRVWQSSDNTKTLIQLLSKKKAITKVWSVLEEDSIEQYLKINSTGAIPGLLSIEIKDNFSYYYDRLQLAKGPSLGTEFTLAMPYVYLAHYDLITSEEGLKILEERGMHPNLLRISVGNEDIEELVAVFNAVFTEERMFSEV